MERLSGWTLFRLKGVAIRVHMSLLFLLLYVIVVATASFPLVIQASGVNPYLVVGTPLLWALIFSVALVISIFLHEYSHVLVAQAKGIKVRAITLMMLGGVSQMEKIPDEPDTELKIAIIGPLVSLALGGILYWIRGITDSSTVALFCYWVGQTNFALGIFNLLPAFPTDGGRVLRAFLVTKMGRLRGTQAAVKVSHVFAWFFAIVGFIQFNLLLILIAFFIFGASKSEFFLLWGQTLLKGMTAKELTQPVTPISANATLSEAVSQMTSTKQLYLPVSEADNCSIISADIVAHLPRDLWTTTLVKQTSVRIAKPVDVHDPLDSVFVTTLTSPVGAIPITDDQQLVGIIKKSDLIEAIELKQLAIRPPATLLSPMKLHYQH